MTISAFIRGYLLRRMADKSPWLLTDVQFALKKDAVEESLAAFGLEEWFSGLMEAHRAEIEEALEAAGEGVLVSSGRHRLALMPFAVRDLELNWAPDPIGEGGWVYIAGRHAPPKGLVAPPAPRVDLLAPATVWSELEEPEMPSLVHPWERVAIKTGVHGFLRKHYGHLTPEERAEIDATAQAFPKALDLEHARLAVDRAIAHAISNGRMEEPAIGYLRRFLADHREEVARAILEGPKVVAASPDYAEILEPLIEFPERTEYYSPEGFMAVAGELATIQGLLDLVREQKWTDKPFRVAYFTYPGDPLVPDAIERIQEAYPDSVLARGLRGHDRIIKEPHLLLEHEDGTLSTFVIKMKAGVRGIDRQLYIKPKDLA